MFIFYQLTGGLNNVLYSKMIRKKKEAREGRRKEPRGREREKQSKIRKRRKNI